MRFPVGKPLWFTGAAVIAVSAVAVAVSLQDSPASHHSAASGSPSSAAVSSSPEASGGLFAPSSPGSSLSASARADASIADRSASVPPRTPISTSTQVNPPPVAGKPTPTPTKTAKPPAKPTTKPTTQPPPPPPAGPRPGGRPGPSNTGVPAGTPLTVINGDVVVTTPGTVIDAKHIVGRLIIQASNVKVTRSLIDGGTGPGDSVIIRSGSGILLQDDEIGVAHPAPGIDTMSVRGATLNRLNIHGGVDGMKLTSNSVVENSWIHGLSYFSSDPAQHGGPTHNDTIQIMSGSNIRVTGNYLQAATSNNAAIQVTQDTGSTSGLVISGNWAEGGGCTFNFSGHGPGGRLESMSGITVTGNRFGHNMRFSGCAILVDLQTTITQSGNVYDDTGQPVKIERHN